MTDLETFIAFTLIFVPALIFWIVLISFIANKMYDAIERDKQLLDDSKEEIYINDLSWPPTTFEELRAWEKTGLLDNILKRQEGLKEIEERKEKRNSDYEVAKCKYVYDKLDEYLNTDEAEKDFTNLFASILLSHDEKKYVWKSHLDAKREEYEKDFDNL